VSATRSRAVIDLVAYCIKQLRVKQTVERDLHDVKRRDGTLVRRTSSARCDRGFSEMKGFKLILIRPPQGNFSLLSPTTNPSPG
jgi:hypothetical protein